MKADRIAFMVERLQKGHHPDTDGEAFWNGYTRPEAPRHLEKEGFQRTTLFLAFVAISLGVIWLAVCRFFKHGRKLY